MRAWVWVVVALSLAPAIGLAQPRDEVAAEALFVEGRRLMKGGNYAEAAEKLRGSDRAAPSVGARLSLGECYEKLGKTASAWGAYRSAANLARRDQDNRRALAAEKRAKALEPNLSYLIIEVPESARVPGLQVSWNGQPRSAALWNLRFPVDPGDHTITAAAEGFQRWQTVASVKRPGETRVEVPGLQARTATTAPKVEPERTPTDLDPGSDRPISPPPGVERDRGEGSMFTTGRKVAIGVAAVGLAGLVAGSILAASASGQWNDAKDSHCNDQLECDAEGIRLADEAGTAADRATIAFVAGGVAVAGAAVLWFVAAPDQAPAATATIGRDRVGVSVAGRF